MLSESIVGAFLEASITGAGLVLAVYALVTPMSEKIFTKKAERLKRLLDEFEKEKSKITADASNKDFKNLKDLKDNITEIKIFPRYLSYGVAATFAAFMVSAFTDVSWLSNGINQVPENDVYLVISIMVAIILFVFIGIITIGEIFDTMRKEFEDIKKKQKEVSAGTSITAPITSSG